MTITGVRTRHPHEWQVTRRVGGRLLAWRLSWWSGPHALVHTELAPDFVRLVIGEPGPWDDGIGAVATASSVASAGASPAVLLAAGTREVSQAVTELTRRRAPLPDVVHELSGVPFGAGTGDLLGCLAVLDLRVDGRIEVACGCVPGPVLISPAEAARPACVPFGSGALTLGAGHALLACTPSALTVAEAEGDESEGGLPIDLSAPDGLRLSLPDGPSALLRGLPLMDGESLAPPAAAVVAVMRTDD